MQVRIFQTLYRKRIYFVSEKALYGAFSETKYAGEASNKYCLREESKAGASCEFRSEAEKERGEAGSTALTRIGA
jgi:hypothetical protein